MDGRKVVKATSNVAASGLFKEIEIDLKKYPILKWSWKINDVLSKGDATRKEGDDYAARIYVVFPHTLFWKTKGINYIWGNKLGRGKSIPNAFARKNVIMLAVESGAEKAGQWTFHSRNVYEDYKRLFGAEPRKLGAIAIMTDTDNTGQKAQAWYGDITLSSE